MTNAEKYTYWRTACKYWDMAMLTGHMASESYDRKVANLEERLGMNVWDQDIWMDAMREGEEGQ